MNDSEETRDGREAGGSTSDGENRDPGGPIADLRGLHADREPPPELEDRVVEDFRSTVRGVHRSAPTSVGRSMWMQAAAAIVVFAAGWGVGASVPGGVEPLPDASPSQVPAYMMLLWEDESFQAGDDPVAVADAYAGWARTVARTGIAVSGEELGPGRAIVGNGGEAVGGSARIGGFFLLDVATLDEARTLAEGHPHVAAGGAIEIAPVVRR